MSASIGNRVRFGAIAKALACSAVFVSIGLAAPATAQDAAAQQARKRFNISPGNASSALLTFGRQAGVQIVASAGDLRNRKTPALVGDYAVGDALNVLIRGLTLDAEWVGPHTVTIRASQPGPRPIAMTTPAAATPTPRAVAAAPVAADGLGDIVVTARRREESAQNVPIALTAIGGLRLEQSQTIGLADVQHQVPSLSVNVINPNNTSVNCPPSAPMAQI